MGLKLRLQWFDKLTELGVGKEYSIDFGDDASIMTDCLALPTKDIVNNGSFELKTNWVGYLQPHFTHRITFSSYDYFISFDYKDKW
ncbi:colicin E3-like toxin immunity protein [Mangrovibacter plantisponsor]|uniref:Cloacin immunity protein n=1 Tax=Mangrovibacter plantisponsor TaxID=451513 RepID=A0A317Q8K8_9ENTR|nr:colicin E3-like toxin immunity protein [Mangrovibacter plantisponsor]PWW11711.1 cloacin immunity protein [Mangrovibacter plantisponsor]